MRSTIEIERDMAVLDLDATSFATAVAQVAAARWAALIAHRGAVELAPQWFQPAGDIPVEELAMLEQKVQALGDYVCRRTVTNPEQLALHAAISGISDPGPWEQMGFAERQGWAMFAGVCLTAFAAVTGEQQAAQARLEAETAAPPPGLKREDSIFEDEEGLGALDKDRLGGLAGAARPAPQQQAAEDSGALSAGKAGGEPAGEAQQAKKRGKGKSPKAN